MRGIGLVLLVLLVGCAHANEAHEAQLRDLQLNLAVSVERGELTRAESYRIWQAERAAITGQRLNTGTGPRLNIGQRLGLVLMGVGSGLQSAVPPQFNPLHPMYPLYQQPLQPRRPIQCFSNRIGDSVYTNCF